MIPTPRGPCSHPLELDLDLVGRVFEGCRLCNSWRLVTPVTRPAPEHQGPRYGKARRAYAREP